MPGVVRLGDMSSGCCGPPRTSSQGCTKTFAEGKAVHCKGHSWNPHACPNSPPHTATTTGGSSKTFAEGKPVARVGDSVSCGSTCTTGAATVLSN